jgi:Uma2 family endonuclease
MTARRFLCHKSGMGRTGDQTALLRDGATLVCIIDPEERSAVVHRADGAMDEYGADGMLDGGELLPGFTLNLAEIWEDVEDEA